MHDFVKDMPRAWKRLILLSVDLILVAVCLVLAVSLQANSVAPSLDRIWPLLPLLVLLAGIISISLGIPNIKLKAYEIRAIIRTGLFAGLLTLASMVFSGLAGLGLPPAMFIIFGVLFFSFSVGSRLIGLQILLRIYREGQDRLRVLIYGAGATGVQLVAAIGQSEEIEPVGFVDDNKTLRGMSVAGLPVYSPTHIPNLVARQKIDRVILAMPSLSPPRQVQLARRLEKIGCDVHRIPSFSELIGNRDQLWATEPVRPADFLGRSQLDRKLPGISDCYRGKTILISGAGGSIGAELCRQLLACRPARLVLLEQSEPALYAIDMELRALAEGTGVKILPVLGSVCDPVLTRRVLAQYAVEIVLHAAAYKHVPLVETNPIEGLRNNVLGTRTLAEAARAAGVERFVLISSDKAVRPANVMGASKRLAELVVQDLALRSPQTLFSMVRFGNVLGSSGSVIPLFAEQIARGGPVTLTHPDVTRFFMTPAEAARLVLLAGGFATGGDVFVLDMGKPLRIGRLARQMVERAGYSVRTHDNPDGDIEIITTGLRPGEKLYEELLIGEGMQTTPHPKILRAREATLSELEVATMLRDLNALIDTGDIAAVASLITRWVEGYHPPEHHQNLG